MDGELKDDLWFFLVVIYQVEWVMIVNYLFKKYGVFFFNFLVVKVNYYVLVGGLVFYILLILCLVKNVCDQYLGINWEFLYVGVFLYDMGKVIELFGLVVIQYIMIGNLLGYIFIVDGEIVVCC